MFSCPIDDQFELRLLTQLHLESYFDLVSSERDRLRKWVPWLQQTATLQFTREYIQRKLDRMANNNGWPNGIWNGEHLVGEIGFEYIDWPNRATEIGYWVGTNSEGRGIVTKACRILVDHAFVELGLNRVQLRCAAENVRSRAVAERLGFREEGTVRMAEQLEWGFVDLVIYGMLKHEWKHSMQAAP